MLGSPAKPRPYKRGSRLAAQFLFDSMASSDCSEAAAAAASPSTLQNPSNGHHFISLQNDNKEEEEEEEQRRLLVPDPVHLPLSPPSAIDSNFVSFFAPDFLKPGHDQYVYRHANGLCIIGLAPTHIALAEKGVTTVDFNVGKSDRSDYKVTGKRKKNAQHLEPNSALCKVCANETFYVVRCCVKGSLLEVNDRLIKQPGLLNSSAAREGYIAIIMPKPADWLKIKSSLLKHEDYKKLRGLC
ncbi:uncharacterized protein LOC131237167 [Magnolia sinica]|uniref:uncharacterized protein LOC131237167 n=1 Tax=Magnolia sinica TaxID=86752 RepID=UPI00265876EE|nr:uncharacterized protein LOC131237167 [Magnolia sinica]